MRKPHPTTILMHVILILVCLLLLYPVFVMVAGSLKTAEELALNASGLPKTPVLENFRRLFNFNSGLIIRTYANSIFVATSYTGLVVAVASLAGFAFAKFRFWGRDVLFLLLLITMMIPVELNITPLYLFFSRLGWLNTYRVQIIPGIANVFSLFLMRQYMVTIPDSLIEAARIDSAGDFFIFRKIIIPVSVPAIGALAILQFLSKWNELLFPKIMLTKERLMPIMVILPTLNEIDSARSVPWELVLAGCTLVTLPLIIVFLIFQDKFLSSVTLGAVKG
ncbi:multiple sugar transport system permease protein/lactose/L-arabinose transport system permease protein [Sphaerochaeta associata]|uniref:Carbohydrate ABC transporter permease n=1 Tax=Sphaerochaeta associata TaxID=1129264 RepID=A0ABY4DJK1_9SPIR|nr:carbohydrate ABC transporter permease [Sphaerochaeta associata]UOM52026.1 carbohydrate ABC transporter permease [Sphaerochaeta associata]SMP59627.1 multiple sugar transport system permease protein/lactose/L-arabinose transport system permease protein [Sphaerochaeta associata]